MFAVINYYDFLKFRRYNYWLPLTEYNSTLVASKYSKKRLDRPIFANLIALCKINAFCKYDDPCIYTERVIM